MPSYIHYFRHHSGFFGSLKSRFQSRSLQLLSGSINQPSISRVNRFDRTGPERARNVIAQPSLELIMRDEEDPHSLKNLSLEISLGAINDEFGSRETAGQDA